MQITRDDVKILDIVNNSIDKDENLIFFYCAEGLRDNIKALYYYFTKNEVFADYKIVCCIDNHKEYNKSAPKNVKFVGGIRGVYYYLKAKYCFYMDFPLPIKPANDQIIVNLGEGMPVKKCGAMLKENEDIDYMFFTSTIASSEMFSEIIRNKYNCRHMQVLLCGQPKTDVLFGNNTPNDYRMVKYKVSMLLDNAQYSKLFVWGPSYEDWSEFELISFIANGELSIINDVLLQNDAIMIIKPNFRCYNVNLDNLGYDRIKIVFEDNLNDINLTYYELLASSDAFITDCDNVFYDYILLNRPMAFIVDAYMRYNKFTGFVYEELFDYLPGVKINKLGDFIEFITNVSMDVDSYSFDRIELNQQFNEFRDGRNCERLCILIGMTEYDPSQLNF